LRGHRAGGSVAYEGVPLAPSAAPTDYFVGVRDSKKMGKLTCAHALVMEMRSHLVDTSGDSNSALLADKMSYGESRSELIDSFGSRKVRHAACIALHLMLTRICSGQNCASEDQVFPGGRRRPGSTQRHYRLSQRRCAGQCFKHAFYSMMPDALLQEFTSTEAEGGPSPLAPACDPAAATVAKVYAIKQVGSMCFACRRVHMSARACAHSCFARSSCPRPLGMYCHIGNMVAVPRARHTTHDV
jgi:A49-like RNA polymerase I associated factor